LGWRIEREWGGRGENLKKKGGDSAPTDEGKSGVGRNGKEYVSRRPC